MDKTLLEEVLMLNASEKLALIEVLYESLDKSDPEVDKAWLDVAAERQAAVLKGEARLISSDEVFGKYR
jgi:predicted nucleic acid-binding protein